MCQVFAEKRNNMAINTFDAIVIGSGISNGWAAKELCEKGLKTLVLKRGRNKVHLKDYPTATKNPWELAHRGRITSVFEKENPIFTTETGCDRCSATRSRRRRRA